MAVAIWLLSAVAAGAQRDSAAATLRGVVVRQADARRLAGADVWLVSADRHAKTDSAGAFVFLDAPVGRQLVEVRLIGYGVLRAEVSLVAGQETTERYALGAQVAALDTVRTVAGKPRYLSPSLRGFENRRLSGEGGHFISDSVLRRNENSTLAEIVSSRLPGTMLVAGSILASTRKRCRGSAFSGCQKPNCYVSIYLDGALIFNPAMLQAHTEPPDLTRINVSDLAGVEFYADALEAPATMHSNDEGCGTLWLWTREK